MITTVAAIDSVTIGAFFTGIVGVLGAWGAIRAARVNRVVSENESMAEELEGRDDHDIEVARWRVRLAEWITDLRVRAAEKGVHSTDPPPYPRRQARKRPTKRTRRKVADDTAEDEE